MHKAGIAGLCWVVAAVASQAVEGFERRASGEVAVANARHGLELVARDSGTTVEAEGGSLGLSLVAFGRAGAMQQVAKPSLSVFAERLDREHDSIAEWFVNRPTGIEHGFTIDARPDGSGELRVDVALTTELLPDVSMDGRQIIFRAPDGTIALYYNKLVVRDAGGLELPARMEASPGRLHFVVDDRDARYPVEIDPLMSSAAWELVGSGASFNGRVGERVGSFGDIDGDGMSDLYYTDEGLFNWLVGSTSGPEEPNFTPYGFEEFVAVGDVDGDGFDDKIYAYVNGVQVWFADGEGDFVAGNGIDLTTGSGRFQWVGAAGDVNGDGHPDIWAVGSPISTTTSDFSAWIHHGNGDRDSGFDATPAAELPAFAQDVAFVGPVLNTHYDWGDINGDGYDDIVLTTSGGIDLHHGSASGVSETAAWSAFGFASNVAVVGDVNCDGYTDIAATDDDSGFQGADDASLAIYTGHPFSMVTVPYVTITDFEGMTSQRGLQPAAAGDVNGDGCADLLVGEPEFTYWTNDQHRGRVSVFYGRTTLYLATEQADRDWAYEPTSVFLDNDELGYAVAGVGDVNFDGYGDILVSAPGYEDEQNDDGRVLLFYGGAETLEPATSRTWRSSQDGNQLGSKVRLVGDLNGDGYSDLIVAVPSFNGAAGTGTGRAYLYHGGAGTPSISVRGTIEGEAAGDALGQSVDGAGDVNGDGYEDVIVGAPYADVGATANVGKAYIHLGSPSGIASTPFAEMSGISSGDAFGWSVAGAGDIDRDGYGDVVIGAPFRTTHGVAGAGCFTVHYGTATGIDPTRSARLCGDQEWANFGWDLAAADFNRDGFSDIAVSAPFSMENGMHTVGRVEIYLGRAIGISTSPVRVLTGEVADQQYGTSIAHAGDVDNNRYSDLVIGSPGYTDTLNDRGAIEIRYGHSTLGVGTSRTLILGSVENERFGQAVDGAGDVNGDFYGDVIVGAPSVGNGTAYLFHGSSGGLSTSAGWSASGTQSQEYFGNAVAGAGDMDGDGYSDVAIGSPLYDYFGGQNNGQVSFFAGNGDRVVRANAVRQMYEDLSEPIARNGRANADDSIVIDMFTHHPGGTVDVQVQHQVRAQTSYYGSGVAGRVHAPQVSGGNRIDEYIGGLDEQQIYKWRVRLVSDRPAFKFGRWFTMPGRDLQEASFQTDGCLDADQDGYGYPGTADCSGGTTFDNCPSHHNPDQADNDGDSAGDACDSDDDNDGVLDTNDNCPFVSNGNQADTDLDGIGDACDVSDDTDADGVLDGLDNCPQTPNAAQDDADADSFGDACDNCPDTFQVDQLDLDVDGFGAACDCSDGDGGVWALPGLVGTVTVEVVAGSTLIHWDTPAELGGSGQAASGLGFDILATTDADDFVTPPALCLFSNASSGARTLSFVDSGLPPGSLEFYLVRSQNSCGEGSSGLTDQGQERAALSCP